MNFEIIDESEKVVSKRGRGRKPKEEKVETLFDRPKYNRTFWGDELKLNNEMGTDDGTLLYMSLAKGRIHSAISQNKMLDLTDHEYTRRLHSKYVVELIQYQLELLEELILSVHENVSFVMQNNGETLIVIGE